MISVNGKKKTNRRFSDLFENRLLVFLFCAVLLEQMIGKSMPKTDFEVRYWQTSDHSHPYSTGLASTLPIGLGEHTLDWISLLADRNYHSQ
ncbi:hypothetical protein [Paenibacillus odorifer]|uniref:hypothetical protein n=1 Tax=Paenibacillus odorifer TaxID=189426 RepID=UPI0015C33D32|nr:hypothetical protein [Paenibacillus odorifer]